MVLLLTGSMTTCHIKQNKWNIYWPRQIAYKDAAASQRDICSLQPIYLVLQKKKKIFLYILHLNIQPPLLLPILKTNPSNPDTRNTVSNIIMYVFICCILSYGWLPGMWILSADILEEFFLLTQPMKTEPIGCSATSAHKIQTPRNHPKEWTQHSTWLQNSGAAKKSIDMARNDQRREMASRK